MKKGRQQKKTGLVLSSLNFRSIFKDRKIPLVTLDERWLALFPKENMTNQMSELSLKVNELLKKQGKAVEEIKGYKRYKSQLMQEIMENMDVNESELGKLKARKLDKNQKMILDLNLQLQKTEEELSELPYQIREVNEKLLAETTKECYHQLIESSNRLNQIKQTIKEYEDQLLEMKEDARELEKSNREIYLYLNDMLGTDVMKKIDEELD